MNRMLELHGIGANRLYRSLAILVLFCVATMMSAQSFHFHSKGESRSATHCNLCEADAAPLPVSIASTAVISDLSVMMEVAPSATTLHSPEGSNLFVRPPPAVNR
jgi:hypothetical protein